MIFFALIYCESGRIEGVFFNDKYKRNTKDIPCSKYSILHNINYSSFFAIQKIAKGAFFTIIEPSLPAQLQVCQNSLHFCQLQMVLIY